MTDVSRETCGNTWHGYVCGQVGKHKNHMAIKNGKPVAMWSSEVGRSADAPAK